MPHILRQSTVVRDGHHNAFTDLQYWQGCYWISYRKGASHVSMDGNPAVSVSCDRERFREAARLRMPGDNRDPKLLPIDDGRMAAYFPSWTEGYARRKLQQHIAFTENGFDWERPRPILDPQMWMWRIRRHDGRYWGLIQNLSAGWEGPRKPHRLDLAVSDDLLNWQTVTRIGEGLALNESDIHWWPDGEAWVVSRNADDAEGGPGSFFACARPPYTDWEVTPMTPLVHAPAMLEHKGSLYVCGRSAPEREGITTFPFSWSSMGMWRVGRGELEPALRIPATGDCAYPGLIHDPDGRVCLSYYSQHAYAMGVVPSPSGDAFTHHHKADVYFAELELG